MTSPNTHPNKPCNPRDYALGSLRNLMTTPNACPHYQHNPCDYALGSVRNLMTSQSIYRHHQCNPRDYALGSLRNITLGLIVRPHNRCNLRGYTLGSFRHATNTKSWRLTNAVLRQPETLPHLYQGGVTGGSAPPIAFTSSTTPLSRFQMPDRSTNSDATGSGHHQDRVAKNPIRSHTMRWEQNLITTPNCQGAAWKWGHPFVISRETPVP